MNRLSSLNIDSDLRKLVTSVFYYDDCFIDDGLRRYDITQALHRYLVMHGYETVVFYSVAKGFHSYSKEMLSRFYSEVGQETEGEGHDQHVVNDVITSSRRGSRLLSRKRKGTVNVDNREAVVNVSQPNTNLYRDDLLWRTKSANRLANMQQFIYNLRNRSKVAIIACADDNGQEFDEHYLPEFTETLKDLQSSATRSGAVHKDNRLIVLVKADACRDNIMSLFDKYEPHPSIFLKGFFKSLFTKVTKIANKSSDSSADDGRLLNFDHSYVIPSPTASDVRNLIQLVRMEGGMDKPIVWADIGNICEQFALKSDMTLERLYIEMGQKEGFTYESFKSDGIVRVGDSEQMLEDLTGLGSVKREVEDLKNRMRLAIERNEDISSLNKHLVFYGNPGTGKTTVARIIARIYKDMGLVKKGHLVEVSREHLCGRYVGETAIKTQQVIDSALDGILFVDEAYRLADGGENDYGKEAVDTILARMENDRHRLVVIFAGYENDMKRLYKMNSGLKSRFKHFLNFDDYTVDELHEIFIRMTKGKYTVSEEVSEVLREALQYAIEYKSRSDEADYTFANARFVRNLLENVELNVARRGVSSDPALNDTSRLLVSDFEVDNMDEMVGFVPGQTRKNDAGNGGYIQQLNSMIGLDRVKAEVTSLIQDVRYNQLAREAGIEVGESDITRHMVFSGSPGTGKTTVARLMGGIFKELGLLESGHVVEVLRKDLVGKYQGHTAQNVSEIVQRAKGGVLFIDEIYSLVHDEHDSFGREALDTLVPYIENSRADLVVILAGYENLMRRFFSHNPGLESRFNTYIHFEDYSSDEMTQITVSFLSKMGLVVDQDAEGLISEFMASGTASADVNNGNGRKARNVAQKISAAHKSRILSSAGVSPEEIRHCSADDVSRGLESYLNNQLSR